jgi:hypothetical protein
LEAFLAAEAPSLQKDILVAALALVAKRLIAEERSVAAHAVAT